MNLATPTAVLSGVLAPLFFPSNVQALALSQALGLFHIVVGLILAGILLVFAAGLVVYVARFNTWPSYRDAAIRVMEWAVVMLFTLIVALSIIKAIQFHGEIALPILASLVIIVVVFYIARYFATQKKKPAARGSDNSE